MQIIQPASSCLLRRLALGAALTILAACIQVDSSSDKKAAASSGDSVAVLTMPADTDISVPSYETFSADTAGTGQRDSASAQYDSSFSQISEKSTGTKLSKFPAKISGQNASALQIQILLDRAHFSPGIIDGRWGDNARKALQWFKSAGSGDTSVAAASGNTPTTLDRETYQRLATAGGSAPLLTQYTVTAADVQGPFLKIPDNVYEQAKLPCLCYSSAAEGLAEKFHTSQKLLAQLNRKVQLASIAEGTSLTVPNVGQDLTGQSEDVASAVNSDSGARSGARTSTGAGGTTKTSSATAAVPDGQVARLIVSRKDFWTHAVDASGRVLYHFPSTLGAGYDPSPSGDFRITNISENPAFHYQPTLFAEVPDTKPEARLPKGPNSPVGVAWMALSKPHYGIHGTSTPETIGYASSHGCVRLTNWDAMELAHLVQKGTPVEFH